MQAKPQDDVDTRVRRRLRELRTQRGLTLEEVATRADIDVSTLSRLESGKRRQHDSAVRNAAAQGAHMIMHFGQWNDAANAGEAVRPLHSR